MQKLDLILVGGGLANGLIAWRLKKNPSLKILMLESKPNIGGNHIWSFHKNDLSIKQFQWIKPLIDYQWDKYEVKFPLFSRVFKNKYFAISSKNFSKIIKKILGKNLITKCNITKINKKIVILDNKKIFTANTVIDGRGYIPSKYHKVCYQNFLGQQWKLNINHGIKYPILMDANVNQSSSYHFIYILPLSKNSLLIEDTHYENNINLNLNRKRKNIFKYVIKQGWKLKHLEREEFGNLPITLDINPLIFNFKNKIPCSGLRAYLNHPTTGYSLPLAVSLADLIFQQPILKSEFLYNKINNFYINNWKNQKFFYILNRMLFLACPPEQRWKIIQHFYSLNQKIISKFYSNNISFYEKICILIGKPPISIIRSIMILFNLI